MGRRALRRVLVILLITLYIGPKDVLPARLTPERQTVQISRCRAGSCATALFINLKLIVHANAKGKGKAEKRI